MSAVPITLNMGVEGVTYQPSIVESPADYPRNKVSLPTGTSIPRHVDRLFGLYGKERLLAATITPSLSNPYVTAPALYLRLFNEIEHASRPRPGESGQPPETRRTLQSSRALLLAMKEDFQALAMSRNTLIEV